MRNVLHIASIALFLCVCAFLVWFGVTYASVQDMLWFHAAAVPEEAHTAVRALYLALMKLVGGASVALGLLGAYVTLGPLRRGAPLAATALAVTLSLPFLTAAYVAESLAAETGAPVSWHLMGILLAVIAVAYAAHLGATRLAR